MKTTTVDWEGYFKQQSYPHDPLDHLIASDDYEESGNSMMASAHRLLAKVWQEIADQKWWPTKMHAGWEWVEDDKYILMVYPEIPKCSRIPKVLFYHFPVGPYSNPPCSFFVYHETSEGIWGLLVDALISLYLQHQEFNYTP